MGMPRNPKGAAGECCCGVGRLKCPTELAATATRPCKTEGRTDRWTDEWTDGRTDGWLDG